MNYDQIPPSGGEQNASLPQDFSSMAQELEREHQLRTQQETLIHTRKLLAGMPLVAETFNALLREKEKGLRKATLFLARTICRVCDGNLRVVRYSQRAKAEQDVYLFVGTHWQILPSQTYCDLVRAFARKGGISEECYEDCDFMNRLCELVAFRVSKAHTTCTRKGEAWLNLLNGTLELHADGTANLRPHDRDDFFLYVLDYNHDPEADCPIWRRFLDEVLPDKEAQTLLAEYIGYCFTTGVKVEKMLVLYGTGSNGKSVVLDVLNALFGTSNVSFISLAELTNNDEKRSHLEHKLVNISHESDKQLDFANLKKLVSGEPIDVRKLYVGSYIIEDYAKLVTSLNRLPSAENTNGFYRRFLILPFTKTITEDQADIFLAQKISATELPGILCWVLAALQGFLARHGFSDCRLCREALEKYRLQTDNILLFATERLTPAEDGDIKASELYAIYKEFCLEEGLKPFGRNNFLNRLESMGFQPYISHRYKYYRLKIKNYE